MHTGHSDDEPLDLWYERNRSEQAPEVPTTNVQGANVAPMNTGHTDLRTVVQHFAEDTVFEVKPEIVRIVSGSTQEVRERANQTLARHRAEAERAKAAGVWIPKALPPVLATFTQLERISATCQDLSERRIQAVASFAELINPPAAVRWAPSRPCRSCHAT